MSNILVINSGSSSIKFQLIDTDTEHVILKGKAEKLGLPDSWIEFKLGSEESRVDLPNADHTIALNALFDFLKNHSLIDSVDAVGHRVVHGGEAFKSSCRIDDKVIKAIRANSPFAPLHNPANLLGIKAISKLCPDLDQIAVFDTAFHSTMPAEAYRYSVPAHWYKQHGVRRYGFHGTSYQFLTKKTAKLLGKKPEETNLIIAHLGSGASIAAVKNGKSVATTMGFTPLAGLPMGTRSGNIDPGIIPYIMEKESLTAVEVLNILNKDSGHKATSAVSDDMRDIITQAEQGNEDAQLAVDIFARKVAKYIAGFMTALPSLDALVFTAGNGENRPDIRDNIVKRLAIFDFKLDDKKNDETRAYLGTEGLISAKTSKYPIYALMTNEELMIAQDTARIIKSKSKEKSK